MLDADLLCDRVAFIADGEINALDTPQKLKEQKNSNMAEVTYLYENKRCTVSVELSRLSRVFPFPHDKINSIHTKEPTLEDIFIQYTGKGLIS